jgi:hypothetical protein
MNYARRYPRVWFWYFWLSCLFLLVSFGQTTLESISGKGSLLSVFGLAASAVSMWPLYGYVRQVRLTPRWLWQVAFVFNLFALTLVTLLVLFTAIKAASYPILWVPLVVWAVAMPQFVALFQYVHRSPHIWCDA